jgi:hypothetical protein
VAAEVAGIRARAAEDLLPVRSEVLVVVVTQPVRERVIELVIGDAALRDRGCERQECIMAAGKVVEGRAGH